MGGIQEDRLLKFNIKSLISLYLSTLIVICFSILILYYLRFDKYFVQVFLVFWAIDLLPSFFLHFTYYLRNKREEYEIRTNALIKRKDGEEIIYLNNEIEKIIVYLSPALYKNSDFHLLSIEAYHYAVVKLKTGEEIILTCLLAPRIDKSLKQIQGVIFEKQKRLFCMITEKSE